MKIKNILLTILITVVTSLAVITFGGDGLDGPEAGPDEYNAEPPINESENSQIKDGGLGITTVAIIGDAIFLDGTENKIGVGTTSPDTALHVVGDITVDSGTIKTKAGELKCPDNEYMVGFDTNGILCEEITYGN